MLAFVVRRLLWAVVLAFAITLITFIIFFALPRNSPESYRQGQVNPNLLSQFSVEGKPLPSQYVTFVDRVVLHGDLGHSRRQQLAVREILFRALPVTASLVLGGTIVWLLLAFPIGILSALRPRSLLDRGLMVFVLIGVSAHPVWVSLVFSYVFGVRLHVFPVSGYCDFFYDPLSTNQCGGPKYWAYHMLLPWFTFALIFAALYARMIRACLIEQLDEDYVRTARAKGAGTWRVLRRQVLRNALLPVVAMLSMDLVAPAFTGVLFIETVFGLPGLGQVLYRALSSGDEPVILGIVLVVSLLVAVVNLLADIVYGWLDPRVHARGLRVKRLSWSFRWRPRTEPQVTESPS